MSNTCPLKSILFLSANPKDMVSLRLEEEKREIKDRLRRAGYGKVPIASESAVRTGDIQQALLDFKPQIVHFSGHGTEQDGLVFEDKNGKPKLVEAESLSDLFELFSSRIECVVLNACYSATQAKSIAKHVNYVIGMNKAIGDSAAIDFSTGFYTAIGAGESFEFAYRLGCNSIRLSGIEGHLTPELLTKKIITPNTLPKPLSQTEIWEANETHDESAIEPQKDAVESNEKLTVLFSSYSAASLVLLVYRYFSVENFRFLHEFYCWPIIFLFWWYVHARIIPRKFLTWIGGIVYLILCVWILLLLSGQTSLGIP